MRPLANFVLFLLISRFKIDCQSFVPEPPTAPLRGCITFVAHAHTRCEPLVQTQLNHKIYSCSRWNLVLVSCNMITVLGNSRYNRWENCLRLTFIDNVMIELDSCFFCYLCIRSYCRGSCKWEEELFYWCYLVGTQETVPLFRLETQMKEDYRMHKHDFPLWVGLILVQRVYGKIGEQGTWPICLFKEIFQTPTVLIIHFQKIQ